MTAKTIPLAAQSVAEMQQFAVPDLAPTYLRVTCGTYFTNCLLSW
jgi:hypothetical protein